MKESRKVTVIMYHYVRELENSRYPGIRGLELDQFRSQLNYLEKNYTFITVEQLINAIENDDFLPAKAVLLTFNDCYKDHFKNVFPLLDEKGIQGCFYPEIAPLEEPKVLLNHKLHFILATVKNTMDVKKSIFSILDDMRAEYELKSNSHYVEKLAKPAAYDTKEIVFIKNLLQKELDRTVSLKITDQLFDQFAGIDEKILHKELYLDTEQIRCMMNNGMHFGILGYSHRRYSTLNRGEQMNEINQAQNFLKTMGIDQSALTASYPWGAYNKDTLEILKQIDCKVAFSTHSDVADLNVYSRLEIPRLDTNDIPKG